MNEEHVINKKSAIEEILGIVNKRRITISELDEILIHVRKIAGTTVIEPTEKDFIVGGESVIFTSNTSSHFPSIDQLYPYIHDTSQEESN